MAHLKKNAPTPIVDGGKEQVEHYSLAFQRQQGFKIFLKTNNWG